MENRNQIRIQRKDFELLDDKNLVCTCIEPILTRIHNNDYNIKSTEYSQLTSGQQSLLLFWILIGHTKYGIIQFFKEINHLHIDALIWIELKNKLKRYDNENLLAIILEMEILYFRYVKAIDFNPYNQFVIDELDKRLKFLLSDTFSIVCKYIRENPTDFVFFEI